MDNSKTSRTRPGKSHEVQEKAASDLKMMHREIEKQRRKEMSSLYSSLRSLLPAEYIKGKRSISDHMNETVNYINDLQEKIKQMEIKKERLKSLSNSSKNADMDMASGSSSSNRLPNSVSVSQCYGGMEVVIVSGYGGGGFCLSRVLGVLVEQGINVVTCLSSQVNGRLIHTIRTEVGEVMHIDILLLQQQLDIVINGSLYWPEVKRL